MPLGSRIRPSSRPFAAAGISATPRDPLLFLYPRYFFAHNLRSNATEAQTLLQNDSISSSKTEKAVQHGKGCYSKPRSSHRARVGNTEHEVPTQEHEVSSQEARPLVSRRVMVEGGKRLQPRLRSLHVLQNKFQRPPEDRTVATKNLTSFRVWGSNTPQDSEVQVESFQPPSTRLKRLKSVGAKKADYKDHKAIVNSTQKTKGSWSYDWRVALSLLNEHTPFSDVLGNEGALEESASFTPRGVSRKGLARVTPDPSVISREHWTPDDFTNFVEAVTVSHVPRVLQRYLYQKEDPLAHFKDGNAHKFQVRSALLSLFSDRAHTSLFSHIAFHAAIKCLCQHEELSYARRLVNIMTDSSVQPTTQTFNMLLFVAAQNKDLHHFTALLHLMIRRGLKPDIETWRNFIVTLESNVVKLKVAGAMKDLGLLGRQRARQQVAAALLEIDINEHISSKHGLLRLFEAIDNKYKSKDWFSRHAANKMCEKLAEAGLMPQAMGVLNVMRERHVRPDNVTLSALLKSFVNAEDAELALRLMRLFRDKFSIMPSHYDLQLLFRLGWNMRYYNICKVVWTVACAKGEVPAVMEDHVYRSLMCGTPTIYTTVYQRWNREAGKVIIAGGFGHPTSLDLHELPNRLRRMQELVDWKPQGLERGKHFLLVKQLLTEDLTAVGRYKYEGDLVEDFSKALERDIQWEQNGQIESTSMSWKMTHTVQQSFTRNSKDELEIYHPKPELDEMGDLDMSKAAVSLEERKLHWGKASPTSSKTSVKE